MNGPYRLTAVPGGPNHDWLAVWTDRYGTHWIDACEQYRRVHRDGVGNWVAADGKPLIYSRDGSAKSPADEPIGLFDLLAHDPSLETTLLRLAAEKLQAGEALSLEDQARVALARQRIAEAG